MTDQPDNDDRLRRAALAAYDLHPGDKIHQIATLRRAENLTLQEAHDLINALWPAREPEPYPIEWTVTLDDTMPADVIRLHVTCSSDVEWDSLSFLERQGRNAVLAARDAQAAL